MQLSFFRKGLKSLEAVDSHVRSVAEQQRIDYHFGALEDKLEDGEDVYNNKEDGELSFDYRKGTGVMDISASQNSMEVSI